MAADQAAGARTDFWETGDVGPQAEEPPNAKVPQDVPAADPAQPQPPEKMTVQPVKRTLEQVPWQAPMDLPVQAPRRAGTRKATAAAVPRTAHSADPAWLAAERIARSLGSRISEIWLEVLTRHTGGDETMAHRVYAVLDGSHLLGELWRNRRIDEVHIRGTEVTVCGRNGIYQVPGFTSLAAAERAVEVFKASQEKMGAVVSRVSGTAVVSRHPARGPDTAWLLAGGVVTEDQLSKIRLELRHMGAVTVTGPAARTVVRALASLVPAGSRVFLGAYATLPVGCVASAGPMEADYVVGVRPGVMAEEMASAGQIGALIANPETGIRATLRFAASGKSAAPNKLAQLP